MKLKRLKRSFLLITLALLSPLAYSEVALRQVTTAEQFKYDDGSYDCDAFNRETFDHTIEDIVSLSGKNWRKRLDELQVELDILNNLLRMYKSRFAKLNFNYLSREGFLIEGTVTTQFGIKIVTSSKSWEDFCEDTKNAVEPKGTFDVSKACTAANDLVAQLHCVRTLKKIYLSEKADRTSNKEAYLSLANDLDKFLVKYLEDCRSSENSKHPPSNIDFIIEKLNGKKLKRMDSKAGFSELEYTHWYSYYRDFIDKQSPEYFKTYMYEVENQYHFIESYLNTLKQDSKLLHERKEVADFCAKNQSTKQRQRTVIDLNQKKSLGSDSKKDRIYLPNKKSTPADFAR